MTQVNRGWLYAGFYESLVVLCFLWAYSFKRMFDEFCLLDSIIFGQRFFILKFRFRIVIQKSACEIFDPKSLLPENLHSENFASRKFCISEILHLGNVTSRKFCISKILHLGNFASRKCYISKMLQLENVTSRKFYILKISHYRNIMHLEEFFIRKYYIPKILHF
jgi:hypothetical protein